MLYAKKLMAGQIDGYARQAVSTGVSAEEFEKKLSPETKRMWHELRRGGGQEGQGSQPGAGGSVSIPQGAIEALRQHPEHKADFDAKYGQGAAARILGQ